MEIILFTYVHKIILYMIGGIRLLYNKISWDNKLKSIFVDDYYNVGDLVTVSVGVVFNATILKIEDEYVTVCLSYDDAESHSINAPSEYKFEDGYHFMVAKRTIVSVAEKANEYTVKLV